MSWAPKHPLLTARLASRHACFILGLLLASATTTSARVLVTRGTYHGWADAFSLRNGRVEVVIVPAIGRVMQFGFIGEEGVLWENRTLDGQVADIRLPVWAAKDWVNFGGDKTWPAPEAAWSGFTGRKGWRPPPGFDGASALSSLEGTTVVLTSQIDPFYGVQARRRIQLHPRRPELTITTEYELKQGEPAQLGIWVITQLKTPEGLFARTPKKSVFPNGYVVFSRDVPPTLSLTNRLLALTRTPTNAYKIGLDADALLWVGAKHTLLIESPREGGAAYPDQGSNTEIYTSPDPLPYIELETLGPLRALKVGGRIVHRNVYLLDHRRKPTPAEEAAAILR